MRLNVGIIFGGKSLAHELSIITAMEIMDSFDAEKYNVIPLYMDKNNEIYTGDHLKDILNYRDINLVKRYAKKVTIIKYKNEVIVQRLGIYRKNIHKIDVMLPIGHGGIIENGIQGYLDILDIPYVGSDILASAISQDKAVTKEILKSHNIPIGDYVCFNENEFDKNKSALIKQIKALKYPVIVRPANSSSSIGLTKVTKEEELNKAIKGAFQYYDKVLVEEVIKNVKSVSVSIIGKSSKQEISSVEEIGINDVYMDSDDYYDIKQYLKKKYDKEIKVKQSKNSTPIISKELLDDLKDYASLAFNAIGACGLAKIDFLIDDKHKKIFFNDINTIPLSLCMYLWQTKKKTPQELIDDLIDIAISAHEEKNKKCYSLEENLLEHFNLFIEKK